MRVFLLEVVVRLLEIGLLFIGFLVKAFFVVRVLLRLAVLLRLVVLLRARVTVFFLDAVVRFFFLAMIFVWKCVF